MSFEGINIAMQESAEMGTLVAVHGRISQICKTTAEKRVKLFRFLRAKRKTFHLLTSLVGGEANNL